MPKKPKSGVLLVNLGTPNSPEPDDVAAYLKEFLMDPLVIDIAWPLRWFLVNVLILPRRKFASSALYKRIWGKQGSPLLVHTEALLGKVRAQLTEDFVVEMAMRYGAPSIESAILKLKQSGIEKLLVLPLYPQYSLAATKSSIERIQKLATKHIPQVKLDFFPAFYDDARYLDAVTEVSRKALGDRAYDLALFSFHGIPERQVKKTDPTGEHCLAQENCCDLIVAANSDCYRAQCFHTAREIAKRFNLPPEKYRVCFQSRLGTTPWIRPYTDHLYEELPKQGVKKIVVFCPSFVADCLETLEEVDLRGKEQFQKAGGEDLFMVPSLNSEDVWTKTICDFVRTSTGSFA